jgi:hypothetical protein
MKGTLLDFSIQTNTGTISGEDGKRYSFAGAEWKDSALPTMGMVVDFEAKETLATGVYVLPSSENLPPTIKSASPSAPVDVAPEPLKTLPENGPASAPWNPNAAANRSLLSSPAFWPSIVLALLAVGAVYFVVSQLSAARARRASEASNAVEAVGKLDAAVGVGITFQDYSTRLQDAAAAVSAYEPGDDTGQEILKSLEESVLYYKAAHDAWNAEIESKWFDKSNPSYWTNDYPKLDLSSAGPYIRAGDVRQAAWDVAGDSFQSAKQAASAYNK